ncbi:apoptosis-stimulating of p53 protein 1 isoform X3 [Homalodisca vitripennis]|uniref:apoptosis-stimulating of p53 protein 1 isoform X3 n=1 Tax=Homalodisca vitripennis TaxID=197043 RepID=UPI001EEB66AA|nr:apoptosis-stimulating of p53 protein 1 isoform X3 [Homalodisca vitripennis]
MIPSMVPLIVRVYVEDAVAEVPVTPDTTCKDVIECVRDPGDEQCSLVESWGQGCERVLQDEDRPLEVLQEWGAHQDQVRLILRYTVLPSNTGGGPDTRNGMKEPGFFGDSLRDGVELTLSELEEMACRQQQQIDSQRQLLAAKEQRLRFLKQHEARHQQVAAEHERLRRLRDRVEAQELKLRKLRALRGQVDQNKLNNASLTSDLDSIRALFNEKEKELSVAVAKVEELTRQLEELRRGRRESTPPSTAQELDKLRRELMYRNKVNEQQNARLTQQREALSQRQEEMASIDKRISELQDRLHRKRLLNQQLANQITAASNKANTSHQHQLRSALSASAIQYHQQQQHLYQQHGPAPTKQILRPLTAGNIAAIEPYHHVPSSSPSDGDNYQKPQPLPTRQPSGQLRPEKPEREAKDSFLNRRNHPMEAVGSEQIYNHERLTGSQDDFNMKLAAVNKNQPPNQNSSPVDDGYKVKEDKSELVENLPEFGASKSDPKYQTLPYNTKFTVNYVTHPTMGVKGMVPQRRPPGEGGENVVCDSIEMVKNNNNSVNHVNNNVTQQQLMNVVHSIPIPTGVNKGLATPLANQSKLSPSMMSSSSSTSSTSSLSVLGNLAPRVYNTTGLGVSLLSRGQPVGNSSPTSSIATNSSTSSTSSHQKPVSSVAPTSVQLPSPIYQTSSTKIHPVQPQTLSSTPQGILRDQKEELPLPPAQGEPPDSPLKPALPPKPALPVKPTPPPPPRQAHWAGESTDEEDSKRPSRAQVDISSEAVDTALSVLRGTAISSSRGSDYPAALKPGHLYQPQQPVSTSATLVVTSDQVPPPPPTTEPPLEDTIPKRPQDQIIKARPLTIKKQPPSEIPRLRNGGFLITQGSEVKSTKEEAEGSDGHYNVEPSVFSSSRRIEMPPAFLFPETEAPPADLVSTSEGTDQTDRVGPPSPEDVHNEDSHQSDKSSEESTDVETRNNLNKDQTGDMLVMRRAKKGNLKGGSGGHKQVTRRVSFDPLALLLDASLEGELELVVRTAGQVRDPSAANDEGITALHNAICAGHLDIVRFLVQFGCDVNAQDSDGWTPLHCAASCNNLGMVRFLVEHGACIFATTLSDHETAAEKCEEDEEGFDGCSEYLYSVQEKLGILNSGAVYAVFDYEAHNSDELNFKEGDRLIVLRKGDEWEREWWWARLSDREGYIPRNLLGLYPRVHANKSSE